MTGDIAQMAAYIGAGFACFGMGLAAIGVGNIVGAFLSAALATGKSETQTAICSSALPLPKRLEYSHFS